jgi:hypothetical protein
MSGVWIALPDELLLLDVDGHIGDLTRSEVEYAKRIGRQVRYLSVEALRQP